MKNYELVPTWYISYLDSKQTTFFSLESTSFDQCKCQFTHEHLFLKPKSAVRVPGYPSRQGTFQSKFPLICLAEIS